MIPRLTHLQWLLTSLVSVVVMGVLLLVVTMALITTGFRGSGLDHANPDCLLVFGAAVWGREGVSPAIERRTATAARVARESWNIKRIVLSGGKGSASQASEASVMRKVAMLEGVDPEHIFLEEASTSTVENLALSKPLLESAGCQSVVGISDRIHLYRIRYLAGLQDFGTLATFPADSNPSPKTELRYLVREALAVLYYFTMDLRGSWI